MRKSSAKLTVAILCGGPSLERGISLNSARSVMDHLESPAIDTLPVYFDARRKAYKISKAQLYSNTPSDFDFKLQQTMAPLDGRALARLLKMADIAFPAMHGPFGEDGGIQRFFERHEIPFVGSPSQSCKKAFDKFRANEYIRQHGFFVLPSAVLKIYHSDHARILERFFKTHAITRAVVKPASGGSSIGVFSVSNAREALEKTRVLFSKRMDTRVVVEPFAQGIEFTVIILENRFGLPVALPPTEIETDYREHQIFDFRKKYLPTRQVTWHCPPRFASSTIEKIQAHAEQLFALFGMRDFARFDGWVLPDGKIWFCDFNPLSGMEQNSFLFQQASRIGMTHADVLRHILEQACARQGVSFPESRDRDSRVNKKKAHIIMGGDTSERHVSLMTGTNVWLKLRGSKKYFPQPYVLGASGALWRVPYHLCLNHTVEEVIDNCERYQDAKVSLSEHETRARVRLGFMEEKNVREFFEPEKVTLQQCIENADFVFIALHGGNGENGALQKALASRGVLFNGSDERASRLCMDKWATARFIDRAGIPGVSAVPGVVVDIRTLHECADADFRKFWREARRKLGARTLIVKPRADGCSTGIVRLFSSGDLKKYLRLIARGSAHIPAHTFRGQHDIVEMPSTSAPELLFERFVETDFVRAKANKLIYRRTTGWIEITAGVIEMSGKMRSLQPSIAVAEGEVLTVEEKFQGGTGVNITPPPASLVKRPVLERVKRSIEHVARIIGIRGYARIDAFMHVRRGDVLIIEVNTLPGLTSSTVFFHQGLAEDIPIFPRDLLELLIENKGT